MVRPNGEPVVLEVNTLPGMTELSILPEAAAGRRSGLRAIMPADDGPGAADGREKQQHV